MTRPVRHLLVASTILLLVGTARAQEPARAPASEWTTSSTHEDGTRAVAFTLPPGLVERVLVDQELRGAAPAPHLRTWCAQARVAALLATQEVDVAGRPLVRALPSAAYLDGITSIQDMFSLALGPQELRLTDDGWRLDVPLRLAVGASTYAVQLELTLHLPRGVPGLVRRATATWRGPSPFEEQQPAAGPAVERVASRLTFEPRAATFDVDARRHEPELARLVAWCRERRGREVVIEAHADRAAWSSPDDEAWRPRDRAEAEQLALARGEALRAALAGRLQGADAPRLRVVLRGWDSSCDGRADGRLVLVAEGGD